MTLNYHKELIKILPQITEKYAQKDIYQKICEDSPIEILKAYRKLFDDSEYRLTLTSCSEFKIPVIKEIRAITRLSLKEAKSLADCWPSLIHVFDDEESAKKASEQLIAAGGEAYVSKVRKEV